MRKNEVYRLRQLVHIASESHLGLIEAHRVEWAKNRRAGHGYKIIPDEFKNQVQVWKNDMKAWGKLLKKAERGEI